MPSSTKIDSRLLLIREDGEYGDPALEVYTDRIDVVLADDDMPRRDKINLIRCAVFGIHAKFGRSIANHVVEVYDLEHDFGITPFPNSVR